MMDEKLVEEVAFKFCSIVNGDPERCKPKYCNECGFKLPRLTEAFYEVIPLIEASVKAQLKAEIEGIENPYNKAERLDGDGLIYKLSNGNYIDGTSLITRRLTFDEAIQAVLKKLEGMG